MTWSGCTAHQLGQNYFKSESGVHFVLLRTNWLDKWKKARCKKPLTIKSPAVHTPFDREQWCPGRLLQSFRRMQHG
eukprot:2261887-Amphidinium_carterae.1